MLKQIPHKKVRLGLLVVICLLGAALLPAVVVGRPQVAPAAGPPLDAICTSGTTFSLETKTGYMQTPDGNSLFMWTFANSDTGGNFQVPSPVLCVTEDVPITVNLTNNLPEAVSIVFPGQTGVTASGDTAGLFTAEAAASGGTASYSFTPTEPGTYLYESGTNLHKQVEMGLYGALIVRPAGAPNQAYADPSTVFDREFLLLIHDMDPDLHKAVERNEPYDITHRRDHYWTINGRSFPDSIADNNVPWLPQQPYGALVTVEADPDPDNFTKAPALIRYINAGLENHPFHPHGNHMRVVGRDGRPLSLQPENFTTTIGSGQTYDLLFRWVNVEGWDANTNPIKDTITLPHLLNLVYKDGLTWFSSDPDLGVKADYPPGTTTFNECGEFYFPWHSHALNEFQNFDEGFGGLATLVRVDPPGGCP
jgi:FtsP/CotA-like multicopper oxidase with cupredoxin domain